MKSSEGASGKKSYLFNVDLLIDSESNAKALELLLRLLNDASVSDYRIHAGQQMGKLIQQAMEDPSTHKPIHIPQKLQTKPEAKTETKAETKVDAKAESKKAQPANKPNDQDEASERIRNYIAGNKLIRLVVNKGRGIKLSVPCRILSFDESKHSITVYHVDEKQVYSFSLNEIDDFQV
jgi:hypothetical protein